MLLHYIWPAGEDLSEVGTELEVSGDPDRPLLRGTVARHGEDEDGQAYASILFVDGQPGVEEFQLWVMHEGDVGVRIPDRP